MIFASALQCPADSLSEALQAKRYKDALTISDSLLQRSPDNASLWTARGFALAGLNRDDESISSFQTALKYSPGSLPALKGAVQTSYRSHDARIHSFLAQLLRLDPGNSSAHGIAGVLAFESGGCSSAIQHFEKSGIETVRNSDAYSLYGACLLTEHHFPDAVLVFQRLLADHPDSFNVRFDLGYAQLLARNAGQAVATLQSFATAAQPRADALNLLATAESAEGQFEAAGAHLRQAIEIAPKADQSYADLTALYIQLEMLSSATLIVDIGLQNVPLSSRLHALRGVIQAQLGKYPEASAEFDRANELDSEREFGAAGLGALYLETNQPELAANTIRDRLRKNPNDATLNYLLAEAFMRTRSWHEAQSALSACLRADPHSAKAHSLMGKLCVQTQNYTQAVSELRLAAEYDPGDRMTWSQLAIALRHLGRGDAASAALQKLKSIVIQQSPSPIPNSQLRP